MHSLPAGLLERARHHGLPSPLQWGREVGRWAGLEMQLVRMGWRLRPGAGVLL